MQKDELPIPSYFDPDTVGKVWKVDYQRRFKEAENWRGEHSLSPSSEDDCRVCILATDVQNTFCMPDFELFVAGQSGNGAVEDSRRFCEFIYRNLHRITTIFPTMDTHQPYQIFHSTFLQDREGRHPDPMTQITLEEVEDEKWSISPHACKALNLDREFAQRHLVHYARALKKEEKYNWTIWPFHAMLGGISHALVPAFEEAIFFHSIARCSQPRFEVKGRHPLTEHYSIFGPEVLENPDGNQLAEKNRALIRTLLEYDKIIITGQAKSHCVAWTIEDIIEDSTIQEGGLASKFYLLEDCTSPVVVPQVVDFTERANDAFARFEEQGMHRVLSTEPMDQWPST